VCYLYLRAATEVLALCSSSTYTMPWTAVRNILVSVFWPNLVHTLSTLPVVHTYWSSDVDFGRIHTEIIRCDPQVWVRLVDRYCLRQIAIHKSESDLWIATVWGRLRSTSLSQTCGSLLSEADCDPQVWVRLVDRYCLRQINGKINDDSCSCFPAIFLTNKFTNTCD